MNVPSSVSIIEKPSPPSVSVKKSSSMSDWSKPTCVSGIDQMKSRSASAYSCGLELASAASNAGRNSAALAAQSMPLSSVQAYSWLNLSTIESNASVYDWSEKSSSAADSGSY